MGYELTIVSSSYLTSCRFPHQLYYSRKKLSRSSTTLIVVVRDAVFGKTANTRKFTTPPLLVILTQHFYSHVCIKLRTRKVC